MHDLRIVPRDFLELVVDGEGPLCSPLTKANHCTGRKANARFIEKIIKVEGGTRPSKGLFALATRAIQEGEEVLVDYGANYPTKKFVRRNICIKISYREAQ